MAKTKTETIGFLPAAKTLSKSIREYKKPSLLAPLFVAMEVVLECLIPFIMTLLLGAMDYITNNPEVSLSIRWTIPALVSPPIVDNLLQW